MTLELEELFRLLISLAILIAVFAFVSMFLIGGTNFAAIASFDELTSAIVTACGVEGSHAVTDIRFPPNYFITFEGNDPDTDIVENEICLKHTFATGLLAFGNVVTDVIKYGSGYTGGYYRGRMGPAGCGDGCVAGLDVTSITNEIIEGLTLLSEQADVSTEEIRSKSAKSTITGSIALIASGHAVQEVITIPLIFDVSGFLRKYIFESIYQFIEKSFAAIFGTIDVTTDKCFDIADYSECLTEVPGITDPVPRIIVYNLNEECTGCGVNPDTYCNADLEGRGIITCENNDECPEHTACYYTDDFEFRRSDFIGEGYCIAINYCTPGDNGDNYCRSLDNSLVNPEKTKCVPWDSPWDDQQESGICTIGFTPIQDSYCRCKYGGAGQAGFETCYSAPENYWDDSNPTDCISGVSQTSSFFEQFGEGLVMSCKSVVENYNKVSSETIIVDGYYCIYGDNSYGSQAKLYHGFTGCDEDNDCGINTECLNAQDLYDDNNCLATTCIEPASTKNLGSCSDQDACDYLCECNLFPKPYSRRYPGIPSRDLGNNYATYSDAYECECLCNDNGQCIQSILNKFICSEESNCYLSKCSSNYCESNEVCVNGECCAEWRESSDGKLVCTDLGETHTYVLSLIYASSTIIDYIQFEKNPNLPFLEMKYLMTQT